MLFITTTVYYFMFYYTGKSGQPSFGRLFQYPKFESTNSLANKSFFQVKMFYIFNYHDILMGKIGKCKCKCSTNVTPFGNYNL
jgi:hypothetical protein